MVAKNIRTYSDNYREQSVKSRAEYGARIIKELGSQLNKGFDWSYYERLVRITSLDVRIFYD